MGKKDVKARTSENRTKTQGNLHPFKKGQSGNPGGRPTFDPDVKRAFIKLAPIALQRCEEVLTKKKTKAGDIIKAATLVLAYAYGKPTLPIEIRDKVYVVRPAQESTDDNG